MMTRLLAPVLIAAALTLVLPACSDDNQNPPTPDLSTADGSSADATADASGPDAAPVDKDQDGYTSDVDCVDTDANINPGATEKCNNIDDDCDGQIDEDASDATTYYADQDGDSYGDAKTTKDACTQPTGYVEDSTDCDDTKQEVNPAATEACNGIDDNCDGNIDEDGATGAKDWYPDADSDGYGDDTGAKKACGIPTGYVLQGGDCNDSDAAVNPGASELCSGAGNGVDDDCDGSIDESDAADASTYYKDGDGDGYGDPLDTQAGCTAPTGYVAAGTDCDDSDSTINPAAADAPDASAADTNCDLVDGDLAQAILVSVTSGSDSNTGVGQLSAGSLVVAPVKTVAKGIELAAQCTPNPCYVLIAEGTYDQGATPLALTEGVSLYGGYVDSTWARTLTRDKVVITSTASPAIKASALTKATVVDQLSITGPDLSASATGSEESVALLVSATGTPGMLTLRDVQVNAGKGAPGLDGTAGKDGFEVSCSCPGGAGGVKSPCYALGESGLAGTCGSKAAGGAGGSSSCMDICGYGPTVPYKAGNGAVGKNGANGTNGAGGAAGAAPKIGTFVATDWVPSQGKDGTDGTHGGGGGGGGAGGHYRWWCDYWLCAQSIDRNGGKGGAGGAGGCGATAGTAGGAGGAALGVVLIQSTVTFDTVGIKLGVGGDGGAGGLGGTGVQATTGGGGAKGQFGQTCYLDTYWPVEGGDGGNGGTGGYGGGGGGGAAGHGGPSYGLVVVGAVTPNGVPTYDSTGAAGGAAGAAGKGGKAGDLKSSATAGGAAVAGELKDTLLVP